MSDWDIEEAKAALDTEIMTHGDERTHPDIAKRKLTESVALAVDRIIHTALYSESERLSYQAATYIVDRVLGKVDASGIHRAEEDSYKQLFDKVFNSN